MGEKVVRIFFRGRNTEYIMADAEKHLGKADQEFVVARCSRNPGYNPEQSGCKKWAVDDDMAQPGDVTSYDVPHFDDGWVVQVVANGGTTRQAVSVVATLARRSVDTEINEWGNTGGSLYRLKLYDVQPDGCHVIEW